MVSIRSRLLTSCKRFAGPTAILVLGRKTMREKSRPAISDAEREVLKALWEAGPQAVREIHVCLTRQGQDWKRSTVITLLQRLERKGYVTSDRSQFAFVFKAAVSREDVMCQRMTELA